MLLALKAEYPAEAFWFPALFKTKVALLSSAVT